MNRVLPDRSAMVKNSSKVRRYRYWIVIGR
jgi:hypothetical protein